MNKTHLKTAVTAACAIVLTACGGGGGGGGDESPATPSAVSDINATNYASIAAPVVRAILGSTGTSSSVTLASATPARAMAASADRAQLATDWLQRARQSVRARPLASATETLYCGYSGTTVATLNDNDGNGDASGGDSVDLRFNQCVESAEQPAINGRLVLRLNSLSLDANDDLKAFDATATFEGFRSGGTTMSGSARMLVDRGENGTRTRLQYDKLQSTDGTGATTVYDFEFDSTVTAIEGHFTLTGTMGIGGSSYSIDTPYPLERSANAFAPNDGVLRVRDAAGDALQIVPSPDKSFFVEFVPAGASAATMSSGRLAWTDYQ